MGDAAGAEVDPIAAHEPVGAVVELDLAREQRTVGLVVGELPHERAARHRVLVGRLGIDVVDDAVGAGGLGALRMLGEREPQWKYWPPSMTMVWPVMNVEPGPHRKATAPTMSAGT